MIEFCTKKRMLLACGFLISMSVVVLILENNFSFHNNHKEVASHGSHAENTSKPPCWETSQTEIVEECVPCTSLEIKVHHFCQKTGYKEKVKCTFPNNTDREVFRSCPKLDWLEERHFWTFEAAAFFVGLLSYSVVYIRQKRLDQLLMDKVHKQIAAGV